MARELRQVDRARVGLDVGAREHLRVARGVDRGDVRAGALERLRDAGGAGEEVEGGAGLGRLAQSRQHRHQPALRSEVLDHDPSRAARSSLTNSCAASGPPPCSRRGDERAADDHAVAELRGFDRLLGVGDADAEQHRLVGDRLEPTAHLTGLRRQRGALTGDAHQRHAVDEPARPLADGDEAVVGRGGCGEQHRLDVVRIGGLGPPAELVEREVGQDRRRDAGVGERRREPAVAHVPDRVGVGHDDERDVDVEGGGVVDHARGRRPEVEGPPRRLLDGEAVHHRVGERDARSRWRRRPPRRWRARRRASPSRGHR